MYAREVFDQTGDLYYVYIFEYTENNKPVRSVNLESSAVIREQGVPYIIGMDEAGKHLSTGITFKEVPDYPALKAQAIDLLTKRAAGQAIEGASSAPTP